MPTAYHKVAFSPWSRRIGSYAVLLTGLGVQTRGHANTL